MMKTNTVRICDLFSDNRHKRLTVLLVEPRKSKEYHTPYPPLGLLKLASYHRQRGDRIRLVNGTVKDVLR